MNQELRGHSQPLRQVPRTVPRLGATPSLHHCRQFDELYAAGNTSLIVCHNQVELRFPHRACSNRSNLHHHHCRALRSYVIHRGLNTQRPITFVAFGIHPVLPVDYRINCALIAGNDCPVDWNAFALIFQKIFKTNTGKRAIKGGDRRVFRGLEGSVICVPYVRLRVKKDGQQYTAKGDKDPPHIPL
jgi:hypothetical protein